MSCPDCFRGHEHPGPTAGTETTLYGHNVYVTEPLERADGEASGLIVIFSDAFGWGTNNLRRLADSYARRTGCRVYIPDFMYGTAAPTWTKKVMDRIFSEGEIWGWIVKPWLVAQAIYSLLPFMLRNHPPRRYPVMLQFLRDLRSAHPSTLRIGAAGFCWGAYGVTRLAHGCDVAANGQPLIDVAYTAHPSEVGVKDFADITVPYSMVIGDVDFAMPIGQVRQVAQILESKKDVESEVVVLPGARHGFAVRGRPDDPVERKMADVAEDQLVKWFALLM